MKKLSVRWFAYAVIVVGCVVAISMAIPLPSFQRSLEVRNQFESAIDVECKTHDGKRKQSFQLQPGDSGRFVYFVGDHGRVRTVSVSVEAKELPTGITFRRDIALPIAGNPTGIALTTEWFNPQSLPERRASE